MFGFTSILDLILVLIAILFAIMLHEIAHGLVALANGDSTAKDCHRLTLNPVDHFDVVGFLMLVFLRFGYAKPVPVNPNNFKNKKVGMFTVSVAGILTNLLLAFLCYPLLFYTYNLSYLYTLLVYFIIINLNLAVFNLLPIYPLDGYRIINCFVSSENKILEFIRKNSRYILIFLFGLGIIRDLFSLPLYWDPLSWVIVNGQRLILNWFDAFWKLFI